MTPAEQEAAVIKTLVMETFKMNADDAYVYILENNGFKHPKIVLEKCKEYLGIEDEVSVH